MAKNTLKGWCTHSKRKWGSRGSSFPEGKGTVDEETSSRPSSLYGSQLTAQAWSPCSPFLPRKAIPGASRGATRPTCARAGCRSQPSNGFHPPPLQVLPDGESRRRRRGLSPPSPVAHGAPCMARQGGTPPEHKTTSSAMSCHLREPRVIARGSGERLRVAARSRGLGSLHQSCRHNATQSQGCMAARRYLVKASDKKLEDASNETSGSPQHQNRHGGVTSCHPLP